MSISLEKIWSYALDLLYPISCLGCGKNREDLPPQKRWICPDCMDKIVIRQEQVCPCCEKSGEGGAPHRQCRNNTALDGLWVAASYGGIIEQAVHQFKFHFARDIAHPLAGIMIKSVEAAQEVGDFQELLFASSVKEDEEGIYVEDEKNRRSDVVLAPVPLSRKRHAARGFNQSALLARELGRRYGLTVREDWLIRARNTRQQSRIENREERRQNVAGAFLCCMPEEVRGADVILVDDVCTTGATLDECAKELKRCGANKVWGFVAARR